MPIFQVESTSQLALIMSIRKLDLNFDLNPRLSVSMRNTQLFQPLVGLDHMQKKVIICLSMILMILLFRRE